MTSGRAVVRHIDHLAYVIEDPTALYEVLTDRLALPRRRWVDLSELPRNVPAEPDELWITLGNIDLFFFVAEPRVPPDVQPPVIGIGFEPEPVDQAVAELDSRGIDHDYRPEDFGAVKETWCILSGFFENRQAYVFVSEFQYEDGKSHAEVRAERQSIFDGSGGGSLALDSAAELVIGAEILDQAIARWQKLLDPAVPAAPGLWHLGHGPSLRIVKHDREEVVCLKLRTRDMDRAREVLRSAGLLAASSSEEIALRPEELSGVDLRLVPA